MKNAKSFLKKFVVRFLAVVGALTLVCIIMASISLSLALRAGKVPDRVILEVDFEKPLAEYVPADPLALALMREVTTVRDVVEALERASKDERVLGLVAKIGSAPMGLAVIQEIRDAVTAFTNNEKFAVAYAETFGEFGPGNGAYYLATAFDKIYLQPSGDVGLTGLMYELPFVRGTLDKLRMKPRIDHRKEFKSAKNMFTETEFTEAQREAMETLMNSQFGQIARAIVKTRKVTEEELTAIIDRAPLLGEEAVKAKLVDGLLYRDEVYEKVKSGAEGAKLLYLGKYLHRAGRPHKDGPTIALIYGVGGVRRGPSEYDALSGSLSMGSETVAAAFREAVANKDVKAIVFRVDSPGGSYVASDTIWREVVNAKEAGKPVVVSMGNVAGSGGYFVAMSATKIVAQPGTVTGSIGVLAGKMLTREFWQDHMGITWDDVRTNKNATLWSGRHDYSPEQWQKLQDLLDRVYEDFTAKVTKGRQMEKEKVLEVAKGRIWTGEDAKERGLVDELGGFDVALRLARTEAGLKPDAAIKLAVYPRPKKLIETLLKRGPDSSEPGAEIAAANQVLQTIRPLYEMAREIGLVEEQGVLRMPMYKENW
ncbi:MAG: signal peptide peptidase SppA [Planctomycetota bacterium]